MFSRSVRRTGFVAAAVAAAWFVGAGAAAAQQAKPAYQDPAVPIDTRVDDLVGRMTLEEKAGQLVNSTKAIPRLNVPAYNLWSEALHGVANTTGVTVFPQAIGLGATFDAPLVRRMAQAIALEARVKFNEAEKAGRTGRLFQGLTFFSPNINIVRDPRWGRGQETYGEDPFLTGKIGVAFITGLQGDDSNHLTAVATAKHYAVHSGPEPLRHGFDAVASLHDIEDTYLPAFRDAVVDGKARVVMCVYNAVNGIPGCASDFLLGDTLRRDWRFSGFVSGDCNAVDDIHSGHKYVKTAPEAAAAAIKAGTDNDCLANFGSMSGGASESKKYVDAVRQGLLPESFVDTAVKRMLRTRFELGLFDPAGTVKAAQVPDSALDSPEHRQLALEIARKSMVLLKNDGILPLVKAPKTIAVVGPLADSSRVLLGNYNGTPSKSTTALEGIKAQFPGSKVVFEPGTLFLRPNELVPASALTTEAGAPGVKAEVFKTGDFSGEPVETRTDAQIAVGGRGIGDLLGSMSAGLRPTRWTGVLTPAVTGTHDLGVEGFGNRLYLDGTLVLSPGRGLGGPSTVKVPLEKGRKYALKVESSSGRFARLVWMPPNPNALQRAVDAAKLADVVVAVVGITSDLEGEEMGVDVPGFKGGDRTSLDLPEEEQALLGAVKATGKPLVVVLMSGSALAVNWADRHANAILQAWYPGEEGGAAIAETLAGANNPAGRLPVTFYKGVEQLPEFTDYSMKGRTYRYFEGQPLYPFGHGLSYSTFAYADLALSKTAIDAGEPLNVSTRVTNTSARDGDEVVQVYVGFPKVAGAPKHALRGFARIRLKAGEAQTVTFALSDRDLSYVDEAGNRLVGAGAYRLTIGGGQPGTKASAASAPFEIKGAKGLTR